LYTSTTTTSLDATASSSSAENDTAVVVATVNGDDSSATASSDGTSTTTTTTNSSDGNTSNFDLANQIHPRTKTLTESAKFFVGYCMKMLARDRKKQRLLTLLRRKSWRKSQQRRHRRRKNQNNTLVANLRKLNAQRRNLALLADYTRKIVAPSFLFLTLGAMATSAVPHFYASCVTMVATSEPSGTKLAYAVAGLAATSIAAALLTGVRGSLFWIAGSRANYNVRVKLHRSLLLQEAGFFDSTETGYLLSRLNNDVNKIGSVVSFHVNVVCRQLAQFLFGSVVLLKISKRLSLVAFLGIAVVGYVAQVYGKFNRLLAEQVQNTFAAAGAVAETSLSMSETVRAFDGVDIESQKYERAQSSALSLEETQAWGYGFHKFTSDTLQALLQALLLLACWRTGMAGHLKASQLTTFLFYTNFVLESSNEVGDQWAKIQAAVGASASVFDLIQRVPLVRDPPPLAAVATATTSSAATSTSATLPPSESESLLSDVVAIDTTTDTTAAIDTTAVPIIINGELETAQPKGQEEPNGADGGEVDTATTTTATAPTTKTRPRPKNTKPVIIEMKNLTVTYSVGGSGTGGTGGSSSSSSSSSTTSASSSQDVPALRGVDLTVLEGDRVAVVGRSGSGKSSLLRSILRFYDPSWGSIQLLGNDLTELTRKELARKVCVVEQEPSLFPMTLLENVLYGIDKDSSINGEPRYSPELRRAAAESLRQAGLPVRLDDSDGDSKGDNDDDDDDNGANGLNLDLDTRVGEGGRSLSGGQRQRVAIARALVRKPSVLLLDEPTAALDSQSEKAVVTALRNAMRHSRSMVMVTHRLGVVRELDVNRVVVMDRGKIVEQGHPEQLLLLGEDGLYAALAREQGITAGHPVQATLINKYLHK